MRAPFRSRFWVVLAVAVAALVVVYVRNAVRSALATLPSAGIADNAAYLTVTDATVAGRAHGHLRWRVRADTLAFSRDRLTVTADNIKNGVLFDEAGRAALSLSAGHATFAAPGGVLAGGAGGLQSGTLRLTGGITTRALQKGGPTVQGQQLTWNGAAQMAQASGGASAQFPPGPTVIGGLHLHADTLTWTAQDATLRVPGTVSADFAGGARASGTGATVETRTGNVRLRGLHVTFPVPPGTLTP